MSFSHKNKLKLRSLRGLKSYIATLSRIHLCINPPTLVGGCLRDSKFCFIVMSFENQKKNNEELDMNKVKRFSEKIARSIHELYISFSYNDYWVLTLVNYGNYDIQNFVSTFFENWTDSSWKVYMGISGNKSGIKVQAENFNNAYTAMTLAEKSHDGIVYYNKLDVYKLILNIKEKDVLKEYYKDTLGKIEKYDSENNSELMEFLQMYLENNGSQSLVAEKQYIHRNTVTNQLKKIEKITGYNPADLDVKLKFYLGFYIKHIL